MQKESQNDFVICVSTLLFQQKEMKDKLATYKINRPISIIPSGIKMITISEEENILNSPT